MTWSGTVCVSAEHDEVSKLVSCKVGPTICDVCEAECKKAGSYKVCCVI